MLCTLGPPLPIPEPQLLPEKKGKSSPCLSGQANEDATGSKVEGQGEAPGHWAPWPVQALAPEGPGAGRPLTQLPAACLQLNPGPAPQGRPPTDPGPVPALGIPRPAVLHRPRALRHGNHPRHHARPGHQPRAVTGLHPGTGHACSQYWHWHPRPTGGDAEAQSSCGPHHTQHRLPRAGARARPLQGLATCTHVVMSIQDLSLGAQWRPVSQSCKPKGQGRLPQHDTYLYRGRIRHLLGDCGPSPEPLRTSVSSSV